MARGLQLEVQRAVVRQLMHNIEAVQTTSTPLDLAALTQTPRFVLYDRVRRVADVVASAVGLVVLAPVMILIALAVKIDSRGPVFYSQRRVGRNRRRQQMQMRLFGNVFRLNVRRESGHGQIFSMYKFRTMRQDAEALTGPVSATEKDPRITRVGRILRLTRLDEIPQLFNVFCGQMTMVGPRPERPEFVKQFVAQIDGYSDRHWVTPGITGLSQIRQGYDRNIEDVRRKVRNDLEYIQRRSPLLDVQICWRTVAVMFTGRGAH